MALVEIISGALYQSDGDGRIQQRLRDRGLAPVLVIDLHGIEFSTEGAHPLVAFLSWKIEDGPVPDRRVLGAIELAASSFIATGGVVVTMCNMGLNRSGLLSALIVARQNGISGHEALQFVRSKCSGSLVNPAFIAYLETER